MRSHWQARAASIILVTAVLAGLAGWIYAYMLKPHWYRNAVEQGIAALAGDPSYATSLHEIASLPEPEKATKVGSLIAYNAELLPPDVRIKVAQDAFALAIYLGDARARIDYGDALRLGKLGAADEAAAAEQFALAAKELRGPAAMGDARAAYGYAKLLATGRGVEQDPEGAVRLVKLAYKKLPESDLLEIFWAASQGTGVFATVDKEAALASALLLLEKGKPVAMNLIADLCEKEFRPAIAQAVARGQQALQAGADVLYLQKVAAQLDEANADLNSCAVEALQPFANAGSAEATALLGTYASRQEHP
jgi:TPR repeat protein